MAPPSDVAIGINPTDRAALHQSKGRREAAETSITVVREQGGGSQGKGEQSTIQELQSAVDDMNKKAQDLQRSVQFSIDRELNMTVVKVVNPQTEEVVRQIPAKEFIEIAKALKESRSLLFDAEV